ncbi:unnamed protein product, partial [Phaeothamnion confervicola]
HAAGVRRDCERAKACCQCWPGPCDNPKKCACIRRGRAYGERKGSGEPKLLENAPRLIYECGVNCPCRSRGDRSCGNRLVQFGLRQKLEVFCT